MAGATLPFLAVVRRVLALPTMWWIIASGALHNFNMYALGTFLASFLKRYHAVSVERATVDQREHAQILCAYFPWRIDQPPLNLGSIRRLPAIWLASRQVALRHQLIEVRDGPRRFRLVGRIGNIDFARFLLRRIDERHPWTIKRGG